MTGNVKVFGATYSVYVRTVLMTLAEKHISYDLIEVDVFAEDGSLESYLERQPFGRIPAFEHDGFRLFETSAITRYIDAVFEGPTLMPPDARQAARVNQIISLLDSYAYRAMVWDVYVERMDTPRSGGVPDNEKIMRGLDVAETCLTALETFMSDKFLTGPDITLADIHAIPMFVYFCKAPEGESLVAQHQQLANWMQRMTGRPAARDCGM